jgi:hypothetical protein
MEFLEGEYAGAHASLMAQSEKFETDMPVFQRGSRYGVQIYGKSTSRA